jgi:hypothetical protein
MLMPVGLEQLLSFIIGIACMVNNVYSMFDTLYNRITSPRMRTQSRVGMSV